MLTAVVPVLARALLHLGALALWIHLTPDSMQISITKYPLIEDQDFNMRIVGKKVIQSWIHNTIPRRMFLLPAELEVLCLALPESPASLIIGPTLLWGWRLGLEFYKRNNLHQFFGVHLLGSSAHDRVGTHLIMKLAQLFWMSQKRVRMDNPLSVQESYSVTTWTSLSPFSFCCYKTLPYKNKENKLTNTWYSNKQNPSSQREATPSSQNSFQSVVTSCGSAYPSSSF
jgi:hypothetical protein